jgi:hypothetical protein
MIDPRINISPADFNPKRHLPAGFLEFLLPLHRESTPRQQALARKRAGGPGRGPDDEFVDRFRQAVAAARTLPG